MNPNRTLEILTKLKAIHEENPRLAMTDITNAEIIQALDIGAEAVRALIEIAQELMKDMEGFKEALEKEMSSAVRSLPDEGFGRFKTEYIGYVVAPKKDGEKLKGHCYRITDLQTKETEVVFMKDDGSVLGITWGDSNDKGRI